MRRINTRILVLALAASAWSAGLHTATAQTETLLVHMTNQVWKYNDYGTNLFGTNLVGVPCWKTNGYPETGWKTGHGLFGLEPTAGTYPLPINTPLTVPDPHTVYFRTTFNFTYPTNPTMSNNVALRLNYYLDDGMVVYLNGVEVTNRSSAAPTPMRVRMNVAYPTAVVYTTDAATGTEGVLESTNVIPARFYLRQGVNTLAVEVHQAGAASSDIAFGMEVTAVVPEGVTFLDPLENLTVGDGGGALFTTSADGYPVPAYFWYTNSLKFTNTFTLVRGTNGPEFSIDPARITNHNGLLVKVVASNAVNTATSGPVLLSVVPDTFPPGLISAELNTNTTPNTIFVKFNERILRASTTNAAAFRILMAGFTNVVNVTSTPSWDGGSGITLRPDMSKWDFRSNYILRVTGVCDAKRNYLNGISNDIPLAFWQVPLPITGPQAKWRVWNTWDGNCNWGGNCTNVPYNWYLPGYNDTNAIRITTKPGSGPFDAEMWFDGVGSVWHDAVVPEFPANQCGAEGGTDIGTVAEGAEFVSYYFRGRFNLPANTGRGVLRLKTHIDCGWVAYLNGVEIYRRNMPAGKPTQQTFATSDGAPVCFTTTNINIRNFVRGENLLALELHQGSSADAQVVLYQGTEAQVMLPAPVNHVLTIQGVKSGGAINQVRVSWVKTNFTGWVLEATTNAFRNNAVWQVVSTNTPFTTNVPSKGALQFRLMPRY